MCFEIRNRDMLARLGKIETKSGTFETPALLPVINPAIQLVSPKSMKSEFGCEALITNAYILKKQKGKNAEEKGVHRILDFNGTIMTDSGAYQILVYGQVDVNPSEIIRYQENISTDIATILDVPTNFNATRENAKQTVNETIRRAKQLERTQSRDDILWVGPIQGGRHLNLVANSAKQMGKLPFQIHALGSPTKIMEHYLFDILVDMILTAKINMPIQRPLHLFGAGHPFMFALAVALGCDMFDSAAYALYARQSRYMTEYGTKKLKDLTYLPCSCPICVKNSPDDLKQMSTQERQQKLARHNLYASFAEIKRIKQAIIEGRLWEHVEVRAHSHPALLQSLRRLKNFQNYIERNNPASKKSGIFFLTNFLSRPEVVRYRKTLKDKYAVPKESKILVLLPQPSKKPFHKAREVRFLVGKVRKHLPKLYRVLHICVYAAPFGIIPLELDEIYPLSQHEIPEPPNIETIKYVADRVYEYVASSSYQKVLLVENISVWKNYISKACKRVKKKDLSIEVLRVREKLDTNTMNSLIENLAEIHV